jgi:hypothetical protein
VNHLFYCFIKSVKLIYKFKMAICEAPILLFYKNCEVDLNFTIFSETELMKLRVFRVVMK